MAPKPQAVPQHDIASNTVITGFDAILPLDDTSCLAHIAHSNTLGLQDALPRRCTLTVVANGPSALDVDMASIKTLTLAVNGSIKLFTDKGLAPTYWAACDPQELLADMLPDNPPRDTVYFVASKCHPAVFEKLRGRDVRLWHLMDYPAPGRLRMALASSVTLSVTWLMYKLGFTDFEYYGWDGCFMGGRHHASDDSVWGSGEAPLNMGYGGAIIDGEYVGGRIFPTTVSWAAEAHSAVQFFQLAKYFDIGVEIHGDGMFRCAREDILALT